MTDNGRFDENDLQSPASERRCELQVKDVAVALLVLIPGMGDDRYNSDQSCIVY